MKTYRSAFSMTLMAYSSICLSSPFTCPLGQDTIRPKNNNKLFEKNINVTTSFPKTQNDGNMISRLD